MELSARVLAADGLGGRILKVNHAGENGAVHIYSGQILLAPLTAPSLVAELREFREHEKAHRQIFCRELERRGMRRCRSYLLCGAGGYALGVITGLFGRGAIAATTVAVERVVLGHLKQQLQVPGGRDPAAARAVEAIVNEEQEHHDRMGGTARIRTLKAVNVLIAILGLLLGTGAQAESQCFGTVSNGSLKDGVRLPGSGPNFTAYSSVAANVGRTYVHSRVARAVVSAYAALEKSRPGASFVYGETGWPSGGRFRPHKTHQNGLSVDFFVPVVDSAGKSVPLPTSVADRFGYDIEFGGDARFGEFAIDFEALSEHLYELHQAAKREGAGIALVIFDAAYLPRLFATPKGKFLRENLPFMKGKPWVRHDEHYHVDFRVACKPKTG